VLLALPPAAAGTTVTAAVAAAAATVAAAAGPTFAAAGTASDGVPSLLDIVEYRRDPGPLFSTTVSTPIIETISSSVTVD